MKKMLLVLIIVIPTPFLLAGISSILVLSKGRNISVMKEFSSLYPKSNPGLDFFRFDKVNFRRITSVAYDSTEFEIIISQDLKVLLLGLQVKPKGPPRIVINKIEKINFHPDGKIDRIKFDGTVMLDSSQWSLLVENKGHVNKIWSTLTPD